MTLIQWNDSLKVHVTEMDRQHQVLLGMINDLNDAMKEGKGKEALSGIFRSLIRYTETHFAAEEKYLEQFGYAELPAQKRMHTEFVRKINEFKSQFDGGKLGLSLEVMDFLSHWLQGHIQGEDKKYGPFLNAKGMK